MKLIKHTPVVHLKRRKGKLTGRFLEVVPRQKKQGAEPSHKESRMNGPPASRKEVDPESLRSAWVSAFGGRLKIDEHKGFYLDKRPIGLDELMLETNRIRKANGLEPVGKKTAWIPE